VIIIRHRINNSLDLSKVEENHGVEVDVRAWDRNLILNHEPFQDGEELRVWLTNFKKPLLILNIKSEGLEDSVIELMKEIAPKQDYFFLDQSFPFLIRTLDMKIRHTAVRVSEYESSMYLPQLSNEWVWLDSHTGDWSFLEEGLDISRKAGKKVCLASPELHGRHPVAEIEFIKKILIKKNINLDAVCTKFPSYWENL